jgi:hypothetical protein
VTRSRVISSSVWTGRELLAQVKTALMANAEYLAMGLDLGMSAPIDTAADKNANMRRLRCYGS